MTIQLWLRNEGRVTVRLWARVRSLARVQPHVHIQRRARVEAGGAACAKQHDMNKLRPSEQQRPHSRHCEVQSQMGSALAFVSAREWFRFGVRVVVVREASLLRERGVAAFKFAHKLQTHEKEQANRWFIDPARGRRRRKGRAGLRGTRDEGMAEAQERHEGFQSEHGRPRKEQRTRKRDTRCN
jgi:hypothetical protein